MLAVHFAIALLLEQVESVQDKLMALEGMHVVAMVQDERSDESQQPCTPKKVFVAHIAFGSGQVTEDTGTN